MITTSAPQNSELIGYPKDETTPSSSLPFSPATVVGDLIFVSGQASVDLKGNLVLGTFEEEFRRSIENMALVLKSAGSDLAHVVRTTNYVRDENDLKLYNQLYREYFKDPYPARTTIVKCLGGIKYEIDCIAVKIRN